MPPVSHAPRLRMKTSVDEADPACMTYPPYPWHPPFLSQFWRISSLCLVCSPTSTPPVRAVRDRSPIIPVESLPVPLFTRIPAIAHPDVPAYCCFLFTYLALCHATRFISPKDKSPFSRTVPQVLRVPLPALWEPDGLSPPPSMAPLSPSQGTFCSPDAGNHFALGDQFRCGFRRFLLLTL